MKCIVAWLLIFLANYIDPANTDPLVLLADEERIKYVFQSSALTYFKNDSRSRVRGNGALRTPLGHIAAMIAEFSAIPVEKLFARVQQISKENPYIYFLARTGDDPVWTSTIHAAAESLKVPSFIACEKDDQGKQIPCNVVDIPRDNLYGVYALNAHWGFLKAAEPLRQQMMQSALRQEGKDVGYADTAGNVTTSVSTTVVSSGSSTTSSSSSGTSTSTTTKSSSMDGDSNSLLYSVDPENLFGTDDPDWFSCITIMREPVSRIIDCVETNLLQAQPGKYTNYTCFGELPVNELYRLLLDGTDDLGRSCLNEPFRVFSGLSDESQINTLGIRYEDHRQSVKPMLDHISINTFRKTLLRHAKCIPVLPELPAISAGLLQYKFPTLAAAGAFPNQHIEAAAAADASTTAGNKRNRKIKCKGKARYAHKQQLRLLEHFAAYERVLYDAVTQKMRTAYQQLVTDGLVVSAVAEEKGSEIALKELGI